MKLQRRRFVHLAACAAALPVWCPRLAVVAQPVQNLDSSPEPTRSERVAMSNLAQAFMQKYGVPGLSIAVGHGGAIVYQDALGWADRENDEAVTPVHLFRIASVTKPITSVAIYSLIEEGRIQLTDRIFGLSAITGTDYAAPPYHPRVDEITVEQLLTHTGGGWSSDRDDPMFMNLEMNQAQLIEWTLRNRPLDQPPGQHYAYSNFGYCVLGRVIEKVTRQPYANYVRDAVLQRCGVTTMTIAGNTLGERRPGEVKYYSQGDDLKPYGINVARMDSHGGWIARPTDLVQLLMRVSGFATPANILKPRTIQSMTSASIANAGYAKGWAVNTAGNWWHVGSLPGTSTIAVRTHSGFCWAAFANTRRLNTPLDRDLDTLVWNMVRQVKNWPV